MMLLVLTLINLVNYLDRQVVFPLFGLLKAEFGLADFHLGILGTVFLLVQSFAAFPMGVLADKANRRLVAGAGVAFWSIATFASGLARSFRDLIHVRALVGIGEASYGPAAVAMLSDNFPEKTNSKVQGMFNVGMLIGGTLGAIIGGLIAYYFNSWRLAFFLVSIPGFILAFFAFRMKDTRIIHNEPSYPLTSLLKNRTYLWIIGSGTLVSFAVGGFITWGVEFITRYKNYNVKDAALILGGGMMIASVIGVLIGSYTADRLQNKYPWGRSLVVAVSLLISAPLMYLGLQNLSPVLFFFFFFTGTLFLAVYLGPVTSVIHDVVPKQFRASAYGIYVFFIHLFGEA